MPAIRAESVWKTYDRVGYVLEGVSLAVDPGEVVVVMGRSGSGKSTLLNLFAGLERPTRGSLWVDGVDLAALDEDGRTGVRLRRLGIVFQQFHLIPELTVAENVRLPMQLARRSDARPRARELLEFFGLGEHAEAFPATLSGGEAQRVAVARALANEPAVILADEPTANLDDENARNVLGALRRVADELSAGVLMAAHDELTLEVADRALHLVHGRLREGRPLNRAPAPASDAAPTPTRAP